MRFILYLTEDSAVVYTYALIQNLEKDFINSEFIVITYRNSSKKSLELIDRGLLINAIISQEEIGIGGLNLKAHELTSKIVSLEDKYSRSSIWEYVYQDRTLIYRRNAFLYDNGLSYTRTDLLETIIKRFQVLEEIVDQLRPDHVIYISEDIGTSISNILFEVCNKRNCKIHIPIISKFENYFSLTDDIYGSWRKLEKRHEFNILDENCQVSSSSIEKHSSFLQSKKSLAVSFLTDFDEQISVKSLLRKIKILFKIFTEGLDESGYLKTSRIRYIQDKIRMFYRRLIISVLVEFYSLWDLDKDEHFVYFPLHVEPEFVLLTQNQPFLDQLNVIEIISRKLPSNVILCIKDHPESLGRRRLSYYRRITAIPNVKLVSSKESSIELIKASLAVVTITGTAGLEGFLHGKKVFVLGNPFYKFLPGVHALNLLDDKTLNLDPCPVFRNEPLLIQSIVEESVDIDLVRLIRDFDPKNPILSRQFFLYYRFLVNNINAKVA